MGLDYTHGIAAASAVALLASAAVTATANGTGQKITPPARGDAAVILNVGTATGTTPTLDYKLQTSDDNSTWVDMGVAATQNTGTAGCQVLHFRPQEQKAYVRGVVTIGGTSPSFPVSATLVYWGA